MAQDFSTELNTANFWPRPINSTPFNELGLDECKKQQIVAILEKVRDIAATIFSQNSNDIKILWVSVHGTEHKFHIKVPNTNNTEDIVNDATRKIDVGSENISISEAATRIIKFLRNEDSPPPGSQNNSTPPPTDQSQLTSVASSNQNNNLQGSGNEENDLGHKTASSDQPCISSSTTAAKLNSSTTANNSLTPANPPQNLEETSRIQNTTETSTEGYQGQSSLAEISAQRKLLEQELREAREERKNMMTLIQEASQQPLQLLSEQFRIQTEAAEKRWTDLLHTINNLTENHPRQMEQAQRVTQQAIKAIERARMFFQDLRTTQPQREESTSSAEMHSQYSLRLLEQRISALEQHQNQRPEEHEVSKRNDTIHFRMQSNERTLTAHMTQIESLINDLQNQIRAMSSSPAPHSPPSSSAIEENPTNTLPMGEFLEQFRQEIVVPIMQRFQELENQLIAHIHDHFRPVSSDPHSQESPIPLHEISSTSSDENDSQQLRSLVESLDRFLSQVDQNSSSQASSSSTVNDDFSRGRNDIALLKDIFQKLLSELEEAQATAKRLRDSASVNSVLTETIANRDGEIDQLGREIVELRNQLNR